MSARSLQVQEVDAAEQVIAETFSIHGEPVERPDGFYRLFAERVLKAADDVRNGHLAVVIPRSAEVDFAIPAPPEGTVMEAADDLLAKAEEFDALMRAENEGMVPHNTIAHTEADETLDERAHDALNAQEQRIAKAMESYTERPLFPAREGS